MTSQGRSRFGGVRIERLGVLALLAVLSTQCSKNSLTPGPTTTPSKAALSVTFQDNPVPFRATGCNATIQQGWSTQARIQETGGVAVRVTSLTQKLDGAANSALTESFSSKFAACSGSTVAEGTIPANASVCGTVGICTAGSFGSYQLTISGTDANGNAISVDSPVLPFGAR